MLCGILLFFFTQDAVGALIDRLTRAELAADPDDAFANALVRLGGSFTAGTQQFVIFYLLSNGVVKVIVVWFLWKQKLWVYPMAVLVLCFFVLCQTYRYICEPTFLLVFLTIFDAFVIVLTMIEYARRRRLQPDPARIRSSHA